MEKNAAKNQRFLDFPCPIPTTVQKGSASNRLYASPRCRSRVPRGDAPVCYRAAGLLRPYRRFPEYRRTQIDAPRRGRRPRRPASAHRRVPAYSRLSLCRGRRPRRPVARSLIAGCTRVLHLCLRRPYFFQQRKKYGKERRQKPTVFGFPLSDSNHGTKRFRIESLPLLSPLPLPRTARVACYDRLRYSAIRAAPTHRTKTFFSRAVWEKHFTLSVYFYILAAQRAAPAHAAAGGMCAIW